MLYLLHIKHSNLIPLPNFASDSQLDINFKRSLLQKCPSFYNEISMMIFLEVLFKQTSSDSVDHLLHLSESVSFMLVSDLASYESVLVFKQSSEDDMSGSPV